MESKTLSVLVALILVIFCGATFAWAQPGEFRASHERAADH
jgi:hypothetical protein